MHPRIAVLAILALASSLQGQVITITPLGGATIPMSGNLRVFVPGPPIAPDTVPVTFSYKQGISLGALVDFDFPGAFGAAALVTVNQTTRSAVSRGSGLSCRECDSRTVGVALLGTATVKLTPNARIHLGLGPELLSYSGGAVSTESYFLPPNYIGIAPRSVVGAVGSLGVSYGVRGAVLRAQAAFRYSAPRYEKEDRDFPLDPVFTSKPLQDVVLSVGVGFQPWSRTRGGNPWP